MTLVTVKELTFKYRGQTSPVLNKVDFAADKGEIAAITGSSGCGKSTLGYCLCGVIPRFIRGEFSGEVNLQGRAGIVFQDPDTQIFLPTVEDELAFGPENLGLPRKEIGKRITAALDLLGLSEVRRENPTRLSGGFKQLVALGGVLTLSPDIVILDETMSQLDEAGREKVKRVLGRLKQQGRTLIMIEHDRENLDIADQKWILDRGRLERCPVSRGDHSD